ncbi:MAG: PadR family transcriptional regulator [Gemmatimonadota bacterium]|jgi:DNA-binding PadR family transcriptional regulator
MALTPLTFDILLTLVGETRHGYGIIREIEARSGPESAPSTGALYLALQRLEAEGLIEEDDGRRPAGEDRRRRYYRVTRRGREAAVEEANRLAGLVSAARRKKLLSGERA